MSSTERLSEPFRASLESQGFPVGIIEADIRESADPCRVLRRWTSLPNETLSNGFFKRDRDEVAPIVYDAIRQELAPWTSTDTDENLPILTALQLSRMTGLAPERVVGILSGNPMEFSVNGSSFVADMARPDFPPRRLTLADCSEYGLNGSRKAREARFKSRKPGGGPVQKAGVQNDRVNSVVRRGAWGGTKILYRRADESSTSIDYGVLPDLEVPVQEKRISVEQIVYREPNGPQIMNVFNWFKEVGFGRNWIYKNNEAGFAENLVKLSRGEPVDFLIWNCIGFKWFTDPEGGMPTCEINSNLDAAITPYFKERIQDAAEALSAIGNPRLTILLPTNEAFDNRVWKYRQPREEREVMIDEAVYGLSKSFSGVSLPVNAQLDVMRWDDYLASRSALKSPDEYSESGEERLKQSAKYTRIMDEAVKSGRGYFAANGISDISDETFRFRQVMYYGVYAGEGVVFEELQRRGNGIVLVNFEEMRVPQMAFLGSKGTLPVVTPITELEMTGFYQWEGRQIAKRS